MESHFQCEGGRDTALLSVLTKKKKEAFLCHFLRPSHGQSSYHFMAFSNGVIQLRYFKISPMLLPWTSCLRRLFLWLCHNPNCRPNSRYAHGHMFDCTFLFFLIKLYVWNVTLNQSKIIYTVFWIFSFSKCTLNYCFSTCFTGFIIKMSVSLYFCRFGAFSEGGAAWSETGQHRCVGGGLHIWGVQHFVG